MNTRLPGFLTATTIGVSVFLFLWFAIYLIGAMLDAHGDGLAAFFVACLFSGFAFLCGIVSALLRLQAIHQLLQELHLHREAPRFSVPARVEA